MAGGSGAFAGCVLVGGSAILAFILCWLPAWASAAGRAAALNAVTARVLCLPTKSDPHPGSGIVTAGGFHLVTHWCTQEGGVLERNEAQDLALLSLAGPLDWRRPCRSTVICAPSARTGQLHVAAHLAPQGRWPVGDARAYPRLTRSKENVIQSTANSPLPTLRSPQGHRWSEGQNFRARSIWR